MFLTNIFYSKTIDGKAKCDGTGNVLPEYWGVGYLIVAFWGKLLFEALVFKTD